MDTEPAMLDQERTRRFLRTLAERPFLSIVLEENGEIAIYSKGMEPEQLKLIKETLRELQEE